MFLFLFNLLFCFNVKVLCKAALILRYDFIYMFCTTNMYWVYISNVSYLGQVYAGRLTKIIVVWSDWTCMCVFVCLKVHVWIILCETIVWAIFLIYMVFPFLVYCQDVCTSMWLLWKELKKAERVFIFSEVKNSQAFLNLEKVRTSSSYFLWVVFYCVKFWL